MRRARPRTRGESWSADEPERDCSAEQPAESDRRRQDADAGVADPEELERRRDEGDGDHPADEPLPGEQHHDEAGVGHRVQVPDGLRDRGPLAPGLAARPGT